MTDLMPTFLHPIAVQPKDSFLLIPRTVQLQDGTNYTFSDQGLDNIIASFEQLGRPLAIDYEHQTLGSTPGFDFFKSPDGTAPAAGWMGSLAKTADGVQASNVQWTPRALKMISDGEYRFFSPVLFWPKNSMWKKDPVGVGPAALTNDPEINGLQALAARSLHAQILIQKESDMDLKKLLAGLMGLDASAPDDQFATACKTWVEDAKSKMTASKTEHEQTVTSLRGTHTGEVSALKTSHGTEISALKTAHTTEIAALKATSATEIAALKAGYESTVTALKSKAGQILADALEMTGKIATADKAQIQAKATEDPDFVVTAFKNVKIGAVVPIGSLNFQATNESSVNRSPNDHVSASKALRDAPIDRQQLHSLAIQYADKNKCSYIEAVNAVGMHAAV